VGGRDGPPRAGAPFLEIARRALDGERIELYGVEDEGSDNGRRLRSRPVNRGPIEEA